MFIWLSDVPEDHGPTHVVPLPSPLEYRLCRTATSGPNGRTSTSTSSRPRARPGPSWLTAPTPSTGARRSPPRGRPATAPRSAYRHADNPGLSATRGEPARCIPTPRHSSSKPACDNSYSSASPRPAIRTGLPRLSGGCENATRVSTRASGIRRRQAASWTPGTRTTALRRERMPDEPDRSLAPPGWDGAGAPGGASPRPEPGAGSAGPGAAQRRRLI